MPRLARQSIWQRALRSLFPSRQGCGRIRGLHLEHLESRSLLAHVDLAPVADNTIFESPDGVDVSNGAGVFLFSGQTSAAAGIRRALLKFDVAGSIPAGAHIDSVTLQMHVSKIRLGAAAANFALHKALADWGEGTSNSGTVRPGIGAPATTNDATWRYNFFNRSEWTNRGGDFSATASATASLAGVANYSWPPTGTSAQLVADVQAWLDNPATDFGWLLKEVTETGAAAEGTAREFDSRESSNAANRPVLRIDYTAGVANAPPTLDPIGGSTIQEDAAQQIVDLTGISAGAGESQALTITSTSSNTTLIPNPSITYTSPDTTGTLRFTPAANRSGAATITVTVRDAGPDGIPNNTDDATFSRSFTVTVDPVNDPPTLDPISDRAPILEDAGQQTVNLTGITAGPLETQALSISATSNNPSLIPNPTATYTSPNTTGSIRYTPVANQNGTAMITVTVRDAGFDNVLNTADDGIFQRSFSVTVNPVNDTPTLDLIPNPPAIQEDAGQQTVNLTGISAGPSEVQALTITATSNNTALIPNPTVVYTSPDSAGSLTYTPVANKSGSATITVTVRDAGTDGIPGNGDDLSIQRAFTVTVNPVNDPPTLAAIANPPAILEDAGSQSVSLTGISAGDAETQTLSITATSNNTALIPNPTVTYTSPNATGSLSYTPVANQSGSANITVTVHDAGLDGVVGNADDGSFSQTFTVTVTPVNDPPTLDAIANPAAIQQDAGQQTVNLTGISAGPSESQPLSITATSNNTGLIPNPTVNYVSPNPTGSLSYTPVAGQNGSAVITVTVHDAGLDGTPGNGDDLTTTRTFTVLVNSPTVVNQPPSFVKGPDESATDASGPMSFTGWATAISPGPPSEAAQSVTFIVTNDNNALFSVQPAINSAGTLTFTPAPNAHDIAVVTVQAHDNGGTANGGNDTSSPQTFNITIDKPHRWHNTLHGLDVTGDNAVVAQDALAIINRINAFGTGAVPVDAPFGPNYYDTTGDDVVAPNDVLLVINYINANGSGGPGPAGEGEAGPAIDPLLADALFYELGLSGGPRRRVREV